MSVDLDLAMEWTLCPKKAFLPRAAKNCSSSKDHDFHDIATISQK